MYTYCLFSKATFVGGELKAKIRLCKLSLLFMQATVQNRSLNFRCCFLFKNWPPPLKLMHLKARKGIQQNKAHRTVHEGALYLEQKNKFQVFIVFLFHVPVLGRCD